MKHLCALATLALVVVPLRTNGPDAEDSSVEVGRQELPDHPAYAPRPGEAVTLRYTLSTAGELDALSLSIDGQDYSEFVDDLEIDFESAATYEVTDVVLESGPGRPQQLRRSFTSLGGQAKTNVGYSWGEERYAVDLASELEGRDVVFTWNDEDELFDAEFAEGELRLAPAHLLEDLGEDMSLRRLLPTRGEEDEAQVPQPGDSWEIEYPDLLQITIPGGHLGLLPEDAGELDEEFLQSLVSEVTGVLRERVPEWLRGASTATYRRARAEGDDILDDFTLDIDLQLETDLQELFQVWEETLLEEVDIDLDFLCDRAELECELEGEGELIWSRAAGHLERFEFHGEHETDLDLVVDLSYRETTYRIELELSFHGTWNTEVELQ